MQPKRSLQWITVLAVVVLSTSAAAQIVPMGEEVAVTSARDGRTTAASVAFGDRGEALLAWEAEGRGIVGRRVDAAGAVTGPELELAASDLPDRVPFSGMATLQRDPSVVALHDGTFLAAWVEERQHVVMDVFYLSSEVLDRRVVVQRFDRSGVPVARRRAVSDSDLGLEGSPEAVRLANGRSLVVWHAASQDRDATGIYGRLLNRRGRPMGSVFRVDSSEVPGSRPAPVGLEDGGFLVAWQGCCDGDGPAVYARRFLAEAVPAGDAFRVNTSEAGKQLWPALARTGSGKLLVVWMGPGDGASGLEYQVHGQLLASDGAFLGSELALSRGEARSHGAPTVVGGDTGFLLIWTSWGRHFPYAIHGTELDSAGVPTGELLRLNTNRIGIQWQLPLAGDGDDRFLAAWEGFDRDGERSINSRLLSEAMPGDRSVGIGRAAD